MKVLLPDGTVIFSKIMAITPVNTDFMSSQVNPYHFHILLENCSQSVEIGGHRRDEVVQMHEETVRIATEMQNAGQS